MLLVVLLVPYAMKLFEVEIHVLDFILGAVVIEEGYIMAFESSKLIKVELKYLLNQDCLASVYYMRECNVSSQTQNYCWYKTFLRVISSINSRSQCQQGHRYAKSSCQLDHLETLVPSSVNNVVITNIIYVRLRKVQAFCRLFFLKGPLYVFGRDQKGSNHQVCSF